jgi:hypothetical protein
VSVSRPSPTSRRKSRAAGLAISFAFHLFFFVALATSVSRTLLPTAPPPMQVELYSSLFDLRQPKPRTAPKADSARPRIETPSPLPAPAPEALRPQGPVNQPRFTPPTGRPLADVTPFYRNHIKDCGKEDLALMEPAERERCQVRITAQDIVDNGNMKAEDRLATPLLRIDPERRAEFDRSVNSRRERAVALDPMEACKGPAVGMGSSCIKKNAKPN